MTITPERAAAMQDRLDKGIDHFMRGEEAKKADIAISTLLHAGRLSFDSYTGPSATELINLLETASDTINSAVGYLVVAKDCLLSGRGFTEAIVHQRARSAAFAVLLAHIECAWMLNGNQLTDAQFNAIIDGWMDEISAGLKAQRQRIDSLRLLWPQMPPSVYHLELSDEQRAMLNKAIESAKECYDEDYMKMFTDLLTFLHGRPQAYCPYVCICAPPGSGKTIFGMNIGEHVPSLHWHHNTEQQSPFFGISSAVNGAFRRDMAQYEQLFPDSVLDSFDIHAVWSTCQDIESESVHLIVTAFERMFRAKNNRPISWLLAQFAIQTIKSGKMTLATGRKRLAKLKSTLPLSIFIDNCNLPREKDSDILLYEMESKRLRFTRSIIRLLHVIPILTGTDPRTIECSRYQYFHARDSENVMCAVINELPCFSATKFTRICGFFGDRPEIVRILDFLKAISVYENPLVIDKALEYIRGIPTDRDFEWTRLLENMLQSISKEFTKRTETSRISYLLSHTWDEGRTFVNQFNESCMDFGKLVGMPFKKNSPYFVLSVNRNGLKYFGVPGALPYKPRSHFTPFTLAPLTGLLLYGINLPKLHSSDDDEPRNSINFGSTRLTSFDTILRHLNSIPIPTIDKLLNRPTTLTPLQVLYNMCAVVASRANGAKGCSLPVFLQHFVAELYCLKDGWGQQEAGYEPPNLNITNGSLLERKIIPMLAPMSVPEWPLSAVELLRGDDDIVRLGVFKYSSKNDPVDSIIYEWSPPSEIQSGKVIRLDDKPQFPTQITRYTHEPNQKVIVGDCRQHNVTLRYLLKDVVEIKFAKITDCSTFIVLCLKATDMCDNTDDLSGLNSLNFYIWYLERDASGSLAMKPIPGQCEHSATVKDVFVLSAGVVWGDAVLDQVIEKWSRLPYET